MGTIVTVAPPAAPRRMAVSGTHASMGGDPNGKQQGGGHGSRSTKLGEQTRTVGPNRSVTVSAVDTLVVPALARLVHSRLSVAHAPQPRSAQPAQGDGSTRVGKMQEVAAVPTPFVRTGAFIAR